MAAVAKKRIIKQTISKSVQEKKNLEQLPCVQNYQIESLIGEGGMGLVYFGRHLQLAEPIAIKVLKREYARDKHIRKRFISEARTLFRLSHPKVIKVTDLVEEGDFIAFIMEYLDGKSLTQYLSSKTKIADKDIEFILLQILEGLKYIHSNGLVHRDIKPSNILINSNGGVKILDFGISKVMDPLYAEYTQTNTHQQLGTPMYMSPEQVLETKSVTSSSDIYSLGVVLWQMVTGRRPYSHTVLSDFQIKSKIVHEVLPMTGTKWDSYIMKATAKKTSQRFQHAWEWIDMIQGGTKLNVKERETFIDPIGEHTVDKSYVRSTFHPEIQIGNQIWMASNLDVDFFRNGDKIQMAGTKTEWLRAISNHEPAWCYYSNNDSYGKQFGKLYNWYAVNDRRGLAPDGWYIPTETDWNRLILSLGGEKIAGRKMKTKTGWDFYGLPGSNSSKFTGYPCGFRNVNGSFAGRGKEGLWWSSSPSGIGIVRLRLLSNTDEALLRNDGRPDSALYVRCVKY
jgi:uncharacterized protein (TIGR02145 family)